MDHAVINTIEEKDVKFVILDLPPSLETQSLPLHIM